MRILTNLSKAELDHLTNQPTAKAMIEKVKTEGIYIPEGDAQAAAEFTAMRDSRKREDTLDLSDGGKAALEKNMEAKETYSRQEQIKKKIAELEKRTCRDKRAEHRPANRTEQESECRNAADRFAEYAACTAAKERQRFGYRMTV